MRRRRHRRAGPRRRAGRPAPAARGDPADPGGRLGADPRRAAATPSAASRRGTPSPPGVANWTGIEDKSATTDRIMMTRMRGGFLNNILAFNLTKELSPDLKVTGRFGTWVGVSQERSKTDNPGPGRPRGLPEAGGALGRPARRAQPGAVRARGHPARLRYPARLRPGPPLRRPHRPRRRLRLRRPRPAVSRLQRRASSTTRRCWPGSSCRAGAYDPAVISRSAVRTHALSAAGGRAHLHAARAGVSLFVDGLWQRIGNNADPLLNTDAAGRRRRRRASSLGPVSAGGGLLPRARGWGSTSPWRTAPCSADEQGVLRQTRGYVGMAALDLGQTEDRRRGRACPG